MTYIDPVVASPNEYKLLLDTEKARIVEMRLPPGTIDNEHSHPNEWVYFIRGSQVKVHVGDDVVNLDIPDGYVMHHEPWTHRVENVGDQEIHAILFELKA